MTSAPMRNRWLLALRGLLAVLFGIIAIAAPGSTVLALAIVFGAYVFVDGVFALAMAFDAPIGKGWLVLEGLAGIAVGIISFVSPAFSAYALLIAAAAWFILSGIFEIASAFSVGQASGGWLLGLAGVLSILSGLLLGLYPAAGLIAWAYLLGFYGLFWGISYLLLAVRFKRASTAQVMSVG